MDLKTFCRLALCLAIFGCQQTPKDGILTTKQSLAQTAADTAAKPPQASGPGHMTSYDAELLNFVYPYPVHFFEFQAQNQKLRMAYLLIEPKSANGQTVVLFHGKNFASWYWDRTIQELSNRGFRIVAIDQLGFGKSSKPIHFQFTFQALSTYSKALLDSLQISKFQLVGHSMGGMLATRFALMFPERVEKLVLVNPIGLEDWKTMVPSKTIDEVYQAELSQTPDKIKAYQQNTYFAGQWKPEYDSLIQVASGWTRHPDYPVIAWISALTSDMVFTQPVVYEFPLLRSPTLLIIGTRDRTAIGKDRVSEKDREKLGNYNVLGRKVAKQIPGVKLVEIPGVGHMPQVEAYETYMKNLVSFLSSN